MISESLDVGHSVYTAHGLKIHHFPLSELTQEECNKILGKKKR